ncbi:alpha/beta hydrolase family protein [Nocardia macrotermitis]|uniref:2,6-dihydropseudooxynicotine hydrolase n=1 Tax=Nocardia macrotermitis TaxID=2585198 RepID=A0A7K0DD85_9NOCA|nr:alpha/beta fold hydrolase [Nocardia macrotermitis]MQY23618.1 2,6-dihydropseudooxynicotine hydrolase [Nocardia macrotermitis]
MFEYFPGNYVWNLGVVAALNSGGMIDEVDRACRPIRDLAARGSDVGTREFMDSWRAVADRLERQAAESEKAGHPRTAGQEYFRASVYVAQAERMQSAKDAGRNAEYRRSVDLLLKSCALIEPATTKVAVPYEDTTLPGYFHNAATDGRPAPVLILWNGLDSTKEMMVGSGIHRELAARGISTLMVDCPGSGEALRLQGLTARIDTEVWAAACVDWLETRDDVRGDRIGLAGWSLGGYYAPRAAAFEKRLALCVAWGANHDWGAVQKRRLDREGENPVPHYWDHVLWVWGQPDVDTFIDFAADIRLDGVVEQITVPFLVAHGESDRQIPVAYAHRSYEQAVNSPKRELRIFTAEEGATEHIGLDHLPYVAGFVADWVSDTFAGLDEGHLA